MLHRYRGASAITNFDIADYLPEQIEHEERAALQVRVGVSCMAVQTITKPP